MVSSIAPHLCIISRTLYTHMYICRAGPCTYVSAAASGGKRRAMARHHGPKRGGHEWAGGSGGAHGGQRPPEDSHPGPLHGFVEGDSGMAKQQGLQARVAKQQVLQACVRTGTQRVEGSTGVMRRRSTTRWRGTVALRGSMAPHFAARWRTWQHGAFAARWRTAAAQRTAQHRTYVPCYCMYRSVSPKMEGSMVAGATGVYTCSRCCTAGAVIIVRTGLGIETPCGTENG